MTTEEPQKNSPKKEEQIPPESSDSKYQIISDQPFPYNIRSWYPDIPLEKISMFNSSSSI